METHLQGQKLERGVFRYKKKIFPFPGYAERKRNCSSELSEQSLHYRLTLRGEFILPTHTHLSCGGF